jgi:hypothetical protein
MAAEGNPVTTRVDATTERKLNAKIVDSILSGRTLAARTLGRGKPMVGKSFEYDLKVVDSGAGQFFTGLEGLTAAASDTTITLQFSHTAFTQPVVSIMTESFANAGEAQTIDLDAFKYDEGIAEGIQKWGHAIYGLGGTPNPNGLGNIVDDATDAATIGGQARATYTVLNASRSAATSGILSLTVLATREDAIVAAGMDTESPNIHDTTKTVWSLYESLLQPQVRADYASVGYNAVALRGNDLMKSKAELKGAAGLTALSYRANPVIKDDDCTSGNWFMLNERYFEWRGRTIVPEKYAGKIQKVSLGEAKTMDGVSGSSQYAPPSSVGWFFQPYQMLPNAAGMIARFYCIGQVVVSQPKRQGRITGLTTV